MPIIDRDLYLANQEAFKLYFLSGYLDFKDFWDSIDWDNVKCYESNPANVWKDGVTIGNEPNQVLIKRRMLGDFIKANTSNLPLDYFEFGVRSGGSMSVAIRSNLNPNSKFYGLDTFEGLPDGWVPMHGNKGVIQKSYLPGAMAVERLPIFNDDRVTLLKGFFQSTLPQLLLNFSDPSNGVGNSLDGRIRLINIDCDTYTGCLYALTCLHPLLRDGDLIYFDEFSDVLNEFMAFNDYIRSYYLKNKFILIGRAYDGFIFKYSYI